MLLSVMALAGCGSSVRTLDEIKAAGKIIMYTEAGFAPYEFIYNNEIVGVDIEIMKAVAAKIGVELEIKDVDFKNIIAGVKAGKVDAGAAGITINETRKKEVDFSIPYASTEQYVIVLAENDIPTVEDLKGQTIGVQEGTTSDTMLQDLIADGTLAGATISTYSAPAVAAASIEKLFAVVTDKLTAENVVAANNGKLKTAKLLKADGSDAAEVEEYGICVAKGNEALLAVIDEVVAELIADGSIDNWTKDYTEKASLVED